MAMSKVKVEESQSRLMIALGDAIRLHTMVSPMRIDDIIGVLAFTTGACMAKADRGFKKSELRQMAIANMDNGLQAILTNPAPMAGEIILPN